MAGISPGGLASKLSGRPTKNLMRGPYSGQFAGWKCVKGETNKWTGYDADLGLKLNKICHASERVLQLHLLSVGNDGLQAIAISRLVFSQVKYRL